MIDDLKTEESVPVIIANHLGKIMYVNHKFEEIFEWQQAEVIGQPLTVIIPHTLHDAHHLGFSRFLMTEKSKILNQHLKLKAVKKNGEVFSAEHHIQAEKVENHWQFAATIRPIEEK